MHRITRIVDLTCVVLNGSFSEKNPNSICLCALLPTPTDWTDVGLARGSCPSDGRDATEDTDSRCLIGRPVFGSSSS